eukprot:TRINITY_DN3616_c0_g2_i4.p1 TRINITY_DN3616_c0_g2~~TRINITY_DN3616_c0_g2_i4.p1  ORF type:complete len:420 (-),score=59.90 TRINITY_DN3616_c0_g2_i4:151-1410(-)
MQQWLPAGDALLDMIVNHLPSPLMIYISKMVPSTNNKNFYAYGRVFSGTVYAGQKVRIMGPDYSPSKKNDNTNNNTNAVSSNKDKSSDEDLFIKSIPRTVLMMGKFIESVDSVPCGNTVGIVGIDQCLIKSGTISTSESAHSIAPMKFSVSPVVRVAVDVVRASDLPKLVAALKLLAKSDPCLKVINDEATGENIVAGAGELHLETSLNDLREFLGENVPIKISNPVVGFCETVSSKSEVCLAKSPNEHNRLYISAEPLENGISEAIERGELGLHIDSKETSRLLVDKYSWDATSAKKIWAYAPKHSGPNMLVDSTHSVQYLNEIKDSMDAAFNLFASEGVICGEPLRGVRLNIEDVKLHTNAIHRGGGQIIPTAKRVFYGAQMMGKPRLMEPPSFGVFWIHHRFACCHIRKSFSSNGF